MSPLRVFLAEAHRRGMWQVLGIFVGAGWGLLQVVDLFIERGFVPEWVFAGALLALVLGLPVVLTTAFVQGSRTPAGDTGPGRPAGPGHGRPAEHDTAPVADAQPMSDSQIAEMFTWNRAVLGGVLAFALLGVAATGYMVMRVTGIGSPGTLAAQGVFEVGGRVVLADFASSAGESASSDLITEAMRIDLQQSPALTLVSTRDVGETLERMVRDPADPLTEDVAQEVALRVGAPAVISGEIGRLGSGFVLTARVLEAASGDVLASFRVTADDEDDLIGAIDDLSGHVRSKVGESLRSVAESEPLIQVTTTSLEALRRHTAAVRGTQQGSDMTAQTAVQLLLDAVRLDSTFAAAHRAISITINNYGGDRELAQASAEAAFRHRERLPDRERLLTEANYYTAVQGDDRAAMEALRSLLALDSTDTSSATNLGDRLMYAGEYGEAVRVFRRTPSWQSQPYTWNLTASLIALGRVEEAMVVQDTVDILRPNDPFRPVERAMALAMGGYFEGARTVLAPTLALDEGDTGWAHWVNTIILVNSGRLDEADRAFGKINELLSRYATPSDRLHFGLGQPWVTALVAGDRPKALIELAAHVERMDLPSLTPFNRSYPEIALTYAMLGDETGTRDALVRYRAEAASIPDPLSRSQAQIAEALLSVAVPAPNGLAQLESAVRLDRCVRCRDFYLGYGYEMAGASEQAIEAWERYLAFPFYDGSGFVMHMFGSTVHVRLARLHDMAGNAERAAEHYRRFAALWADADPAQQPRVRDALARAAALGAEG